MVNRFWQSVDAILEDVSASETIVWRKTINLKTTIFQCSKNYGVAKLKVAPTMTDLISPYRKQTVSLQKIAYFVFYLKIISPFLKVYIHLIVNCVRKSRMTSKLRIDHAVLEFLIKTIYWLF